MKRRDMLAGLLLTATAGVAVAGEGEKKKGSDATFIPVGGLKVSVLRRGGAHGVLSLECGLDVPDKALFARVQSLMPRLRAAYVQRLQLYATGLSPGEPPEPELIGRELQRQTDMLAGRPGARLLLGSIIIN